MRKSSTTSTSHLPLRSCLTAAWRRVGRWHGSLPATLRAEDWCLPQVLRASHGAPARYGGHMAGKAGEEAVVETVDGAEMGRDKGVPASKRAGRRGAPGTRAFRAAIWRRVLAHRDALDSRPRAGRETTREGDGLADFLERQVDYYFDLRGEDPHVDESRLVAVMAVALKAIEVLAGATVTLADIAEVRYLTTAPDAEVAAALAPHGIVCS
jgi:hypothetical protein